MPILPTHMHILPNHMHILIVSQFYHPEMGAPAARFGDFAHYFVKAGHRVSVLTTFPNFPHGQLYPGHTQKLAKLEIINDIQVIRTPILALGGHTPLRKALLYASFAVSSLLQGGLRDLRPDIVIGTTPPPTVGVTSLLLAKRFGAPHVLDVRDIWPEAVVNAGRVKAGPAISALEQLNRFVLTHSAGVTTVSEGKRTRLIEMGARPAAVEVLPNGADLQRFDREAAKSGAAAALWLRDQGVPGDRQLAVYAGVFNPPQGLDLVLDIASQRLKRGSADVHFALIGDGALRSHLAERIKNEGLSNVTLAGPVDRSMVAALYRHAWATLVILRPRKDEHTVPSKIYESMASGRPVLLCADGEVVRIAQAADCGATCAAGDGDGLQAAIDGLLANTARADQCGANGRRYVEQFNDRAVLAGKYLEMLQSIVDGRR